MKKYLILLCLIWIVNVEAQIPKDTLFGKVKSIREKLVFLDSKIQTYTIFGIGRREGYGHAGFISPEFTIKHFKDLWYKSPFVHYLNYYKKYHENGMAAEETWYYKTGEKICTYKYDYDTALNLIRKRQLRNKNSVYTNEYHYNTYNYPHQSLQLRTSVSYYSDFGNYRFDFFQYDTLGRLIQVNSFDQDGETFGTIYEYSKYGNSTVTKKFSHHPFKYDPSNIGLAADSVGANYLLSKNSYDSIGNLIEEAWYVRPVGGIPSLKWEKRYLYNEAQLSIETHFDGSVNDKELFFYNEKKQIIKDSVSIYFLKEYFYDNDNLSKLIYTERKSNNNFLKEDEITTINFTYIYDKMGNWIKQTKSLNGKLLFIWKRKIAYYEKYN